MMKILAIDSSGLTASVALVTEGAVLAEYSTNYKKTHSQTLLPMAAQILSMTDTKPEDLDAVAVAAGPGSFTGLRIGAGTAKGIALSADLPLVGISTLEAMAWTFAGSGITVCPVMDARRDQLYSAVYRFDGSDHLVIRPDAARSFKEVAEMLNEEGSEVILTGDGLIPAENYLKEALNVPFCIAPVFHSRQRAAVLGDLALRYAAEGKFSNADTFSPVYLRPSQAERVRKEKQEHAEKQEHTETPAKGTAEPETGENA